MAHKSQPDPDAKEAVLLMRQAPSIGRGRRSPVMVWMWKNRATLEASFKETAPAWSVLADYLADQGMTDGNGKRPTARTLRKAWARLQATKPAAPSAPNDPVVAPKVRALPQPIMPEDAPAADEPEDLSKMFPLLSRPSKGAVPLPSTGTQLPLMPASPLTQAPAAASIRTFRFATPKER